jgi:Ran GTPase-activating protein (RanGAP) involved in mRNA processing and transport
MNYSIEGLGLKLNTREDIEPYLRQIEPNISHLEEIHLCGNTIGVGAAQALAEVLKKASGIRVRLVFISFQPFSTDSRARTGCGFCRHLHWPPHHRDSNSVICTL